MKKTLLVLATAGILLAQSIRIPGGGASPTAVSCSLSYTTNLAVWVKADAGLTCTGGCTGTNLVTAWADQSGNSNNLTTSLSALTYAAAGINGLPAVRFPGVAVGPPGPSSFAFTTPLNLGTSTTFLVVNYTASGNNPEFLGGLTGSFAYRLNTNLQEAVKTFTAILASGSGAVSGSAYHQINLNSVDGSTKTFRLDRASNGSGSDAATISANTSVVGHNGQQAANGCADIAACGEFIGTIAEMLIYTASLSGGNVTTVEDYLNCRYGI